MAPAKMPPEKWQLVRNRWETDEREGFQWVVNEMTLPVSAPAVRKKANTEGWKKRPIKVSPATVQKVKEAALKPARGPMPKGAKPAAEEKPSPHESETCETCDTKSLTMFGVFDDLTSKQELFVREYMTDFNGVQATIRAGYSEGSPHSQSVQLLRNPKVQRAIAVLMRDRVQRMGHEADELVKFHLAVLAFDVNELIEHRVYACRHCWGVDHAYQHSPSTWQKERDQFQKRWQKLSELERAVLGDFPAVPPDGWYEAKRGPHPDCPECHGDGHSKTIFKDTRYLSPVASLIYAGIKEGKDGTEFLTLQKQKSLDTLSTHLGLNKQVEAQVNVAVVTETATRFDAIMAEARKRQQQVLIERGYLDDGSAP